MDSIEQLLASVKAEYEKQAKTQQPNVSEPLTQPSAKHDKGIDDLLASVKADYQQQDRAEQQLKEQQLKTERLRQQQLQQQQLEELTRRAKEWLASLDPLSSEGIWFEQFSAKYSSKLAAAIDYLQSQI